MPTCQPAHPDLPSYFLLPPYPDQLPNYRILVPHRGEELFRLPASTYEPPPGEGAPTGPKAERDSLSSLSSKGSASRATRLVGLRWAAGRSGLRWPGRGRPRRMRLRSSRISQPRTMEARAEPMRALTSRSSQPSISSRQRLTASASLS